MFPRPEVAQAMNKFVRVRLYIDGAGKVFERQQKMQQERFGTVALPYYAILRADGSPVATFPGLTRPELRCWVAVRGEPARPIRTLHGLCHFRSAKPRTAGNGFPRRTGESA